MQNAKQELLERYKKSIDEIIMKYEGIDDTEDGIIEINSRGMISIIEPEMKFNEIDLYKIENLSFSKQGAKRKRTVFNMLGFPDLYYGVCCRCEFDDIFYFLRL